MKTTNFIAGEETHAPNQRKPPSSETTIFPKPLEQITKADIDALINEKRAESKTLEYKMKLSDQTEDAKKEFLADISSFANASGGDAIYGIESDKDANGKNNGQPKAVAPIISPNSDATKLLLESSIRDGIAPRLPVRIQAIKGWIRRRQDQCVI